MILRYLLILLIVASAPCLGEAQDKVPPKQSAAGPPVINVAVPPQQPPIINLPANPPSPMWPSVAGLIIGVLGTGASVFAAVAAMRAAKATEATVSHMQAASLEQSRPYIVVSLELDVEEHWFELVLRNVGRTPALNVVALGSPIQTRIERFNDDQAGWPEAIASVAPGQEFRKMIGPDSLFYTKDGWHPEITIQLKYTDKAGANYSESIALSFSAFEGAMYDNKHQRIEHALSDIARHTRIFDFGSSFGDPLFWRIWDSLAKSGLELHVRQDGEGTTLAFARKKESGTKTAEAAEVKPKSRPRRKESNG